MRHVPQPVLAVLAVVALGACGHYEFEPPDREVKVLAAAAEYSPALFDTVSWESEDARDLLGNQLYVEHCRNCHGPLGKGGTDYATEQKLPVPSLVEPAWPLAQPDSLHRAIFVGHAEGMPIFGDHDLGPREIDAVTGYILNVLRPDVLGAPGS